MKKQSGAAQGLVVATGNRMRNDGRFYHTMKEKEITEVYDNDVIVEEDY